MQSWKQCADNVPQCATMCLIMCASGAQANWWYLGRHIVSMILYLHIYYAQLASVYIYLYIKYMNYKYIYIGIYIYIYISVFYDTITSSTKGYLELYN